MGFDELVLTTDIELLRGAYAHLKAAAEQALKPPVPAAAPERPSL
jgi:hypothetical protein